MIQDSLSESASFKQYPSDKQRSETKPDDKRRAGSYLLHDFSNIPAAC